LLRAIVVCIVIIGGRLLLVISYDVMRADDVSSEYLHPLQERLFQLGTQFKHLLNEFLQFWWVPNLDLREVLSFKVFPYKNIHPKEYLQDTFSCGNLWGKNVWLLLGMEPVYHGMWWRFNIHKAK
jgi:hypothetical protein